MMRRCSVHGSWVLDGDAVALREVITGSGPGVMVYACHQCVREHGLIPRAAVRPDAPSQVPAS